MEGINYPGMVGTEKDVGEYYFNEFVKIITNEEIGVFYDLYGNARFRNLRTGRFISEENMFKLVDEKRLNIKDSNLNDLVAPSL